MDGSLGRARQSGSGGALTPLRRCTSQVPCPRLLACEVRAVGLIERGSANLTGTFSGPPWRTSGKMTARLGVALLARR